MDINIEKLSEFNLDDYLLFFDNIAFKDNPDWFGCYCNFYHFNGTESEWSERQGLDNRNSVIKNVKQSKFNGYLAYAEDRPVAWCNVNDPEAYGTFFKYPDGLISPAEKPSASIVCFITASEFRRKGIASLILDRVIEDYGNLGYRSLEAYPHKNIKTDAGEYHGPLSLYMTKGFSIIEEFENYTVVRKVL
jgi:ribosomal protein S18 acetylase RimI-like enzyme